MKLKFFHADTTMTKSSPLPLIECSTLYTPTTQNQLTQNLSHKEILRLLAICDISRKKIHSAFYTFVFIVTIFVCWRKPESRNI